MKAKSEQVKEMKKKQKSEMQLKTEMFNKIAQQQSPESRNDVGAETKQKSDKMVNKFGEEGRRFINYRDMMRDKELPFPLLGHEFEGMKEGVQFSTVPEVDIDTGTKFPNVGLYGAERFSNRTA